MERIDRNRGEIDVGAAGPPQKGDDPLPLLPALAIDCDVDFYAEKNVPHGKVIRAAYPGHRGRQKRMHIYLPPDYDRDSRKTYPVLYLNHGGKHDDANWTSTCEETGGSAHLIVDNLIAEGKANPMVIAMPDTRDCVCGKPPLPGKNDACTRAYLHEIIPYVERHFRVKTGRENRALAGLSMGGFVVLNTGLSHLETFSELYVFSSGYRNAEDQLAFEKNFERLFQDPRTRDLFRVPFYMAQGETDFALPNGRRVRAVFDRHGIQNIWVLSSGGHEWKNWRRYLHQTAQLMFPESGRK